MKQYIDILKKVLADGKMSENRTGIPALRIATGATFEHDMSDGFPLVTTKKMGLKNIATELEFFIHGITDKKWLQDRNCHIWDEWSNPAKWKPLYNDFVAVMQKRGYDISGNATLELKNYAMSIERDLGPIYGWQWRHFGGVYKFDAKEIDNTPTNNVSPINRGVDQLANAIKTIKNDPQNRRIIVSAWNPADESNMALPPCHIMHQVLVEDGKLNLIWTQRSCDLFLGIPYNIASYALLLLLYAKETGLKPGVLKGELHDVHIYENHIDQVKTQIKRKPYPLPTVEIPNTHWTGMLKWHADKGFTLKDYICHERLRGDVAR
ncbi:MAG: thymidylate synthase [Alphaproteobacteria bacterium]|nr:thymidylate synthase [Alphaproteobacteria bacterium]